MNPVPPWRMPPVIQCPHCEHLARYRFSTGDVCEHADGRTYFTAGQPGLACESHRREVFDQLGARYAFVHMEPLRLTWWHWTRRTLRRRPSWQRLAALLKSPGDTP